MVNISDSSFDSSNESINQDTLKDDEILPTISNPHIKSNYSLIKVLGKGSYGKVYLAINLQTKQKIAMKISNKSLLKDKDIMRTRREIIALKKCDHPHIIKLYDSVEDDLNFYIITEYCRDEDMFEYIQKKKYLNKNKIYFYFSQLLDSIEYLHNLGIFHRDLKPENIFMTNNSDTIKLGDFGLCNFSSNSISDKKANIFETPCGSPCYSPPEIIRGKKYKGNKTDIWSLGVCLYVMAHGYFPFEDNDDLGRNICKEEPYYSKKVSTKVIDLIKIMLIKDPDERPTIDEIKTHYVYLSGKRLNEKWFQKFSEKYESKNISGSCKILPTYKLKEDSITHLNSVNVAKNILEEIDAKKIKPRLSHKRLIIDTEPIKNKKSKLAEIKNEIEKINDLKEKISPELKSKTLKEQLDLFNENEYKSDQKNKTQSFKILPVSSKKIKNTQDSDDTSKEDINKNLSNMKFKLFNKNKKISNIANLKIGFKGDSKGSKDMVAFKYNSTEENLKLPSINKNGHNSNKNLNIVLDKGESEKNVTSKKNNNYIASLEEIKEIDDSQNKSSFYDRPEKNKNYGNDSIRTINKRPKLDFISSLTPERKKVKKSKIKDI